MSMLFELACELSEVSKRNDLSIELAEVSNTMTCQTNSNSPNSQNSMTRQSNLSIEVAEHNGL